MKDRSLEGRKTWRKRNLSVRSVVALESGETVVGTRPMAKSSGTSAEPASTGFQASLTRLPAIPLFFCCALSWGLVGLGF